MPAHSRPPSHDNDAVLHLKMDERLYRIALHPSDKSSLGYLGFELGGPPELTNAIEEVRSSGTDIHLCTQDEAKARGVAGLAACSDPMGNRIELFYGQASDHNFKSPTNAHPFKTGVLGMGHCLLLVPDIHQATDFYKNVLGFKLSDYTAGGKIQFLHCNERHHTVALAEVGGANGIQHLMLELEDLDDVGRTLDRVKSKGIQVTAELGRHSNDRIVSFYARSPSDMDVEIGWGARLIDRDWTPVEFEGDVWGHQGLSDSIREVVAKIKTRES